jgi:hypothetical protein
VLGQFARLIAEVAVVAGVAAVAAVLVRRRGRAHPPALVVVAVLAVALVVSTLGHAVGAARVLNQSRKDAVTAQVGLEHCFTESVTGGPFVPERDAFMQWVKRRLPAQAIYQVTPYSGPPDAWCLTTVLLPALPAGPGASTPDWTIVAGSPSPAIAADIAHHDPNVTVFAPGYALMRGVP